MILNLINWKAALFTIILSSAVAYLAFLRATSTACWL